MTKVTNEQFDTVLFKILDEYAVNEVLWIPGIYEILAEHFNNDVLEAIKETNE